MDKMKSDATPGIQQAGQAAISAAQKVKSTSTCDTSAQAM